MTYPYRSRPTEKNPFSVAALNSYVKGLMDGDGLLARVYVKGEVSNFKRYPSGHCYFSLKDKTSVLRCVMFRYNAQSLKSDIANGTEVTALGSVQVYERDGAYQLVCEELITGGTGDLMRRYEILRAKLEAEGLFDSARKRPLPKNIHTVGVITSSAGAAVHDIITVSGRRNGGVRILLYPVQVQGKEASAQIARAIGFFNREKLADVLIVGRGGGSMEDLWAFNEEPTVRAIAASGIVVVSAVGHETDFTLSDFAADIRAATPSAAAETVCTDLAEQLAHARQLTERMRSTLAGRIKALSERLAKLTQRPVFKDPSRLYTDKAALLKRLLDSRALCDPCRTIDEKAQRLDIAAERLCANMQKKTETAQRRLDVALAKLEAISPYEVFRRGYSCMKNEKKRIVSSINEIHIGETITTTLTDGTAVSVVQHIERR